MSLPPKPAPRRGTHAPLPADECWRLLDTTTVGRLGFTADDGVVILPVNFLIFEQRVILRTEPQTSIAALAEGRDEVAFEVDHHDDLNQSGWSVLLQGSTAELDADEAARAVASTHRLGPWAPGDRSLVIALTPRNISGRRVALR